MQKFTGSQYLKIDIASNFGLDKKTWNERISWFDSNEHRLMELMPKADNPALYFAGVQAWQAFKLGKPSGYPISLDATSSGLQILACLTGDRKAAELCNVVKYIADNGGLDFSPEAEAERRDGYTVIYNYMVSRIGENAKIERDDVKQAIMTSLYGSKAVPKEVFGEGILLHIFYETMKALAPAAWELNEAFTDMWDSEALINSWVLPDNFHVHVKVMTRVKEVVHFMNEPYDTFRTVNQPTEEGRSLGANVTHSIDGMIVREIGRRCNYDPVRISDVKQVLLTDEPVYLDGYNHEVMVNTLWNHYMDSGYLSARILDHIDSATINLVDPLVIGELIASLPEKPFQVLMIHDAFRCLPNYGNDLREQYNIQLTSIAKSNLLQYLISQILKRPVNIGKLDPDMWKDIMDTEYGLS